MGKPSILMYTTHGTYGRDDDAYGALLVANTALAKGVDTTLALIDDGVAMAKKDQDTQKIGLPNNIEEIQDFIDLCGRLIVVKESLEERGISQQELVEDTEIVSIKELVPIIEEHTLSLTF